MGKVNKMQVEDEPTVNKVKKVMRRKIAKATQPSKMMVQQTPIKQSKPKVKQIKQHKKQIKNISIFRQLKKSLQKPNKQEKKLSRGQKRRSLVKSKIIFRKKLQQSITNRKAVTEQAQAVPVTPTSQNNKSHSLGSQARAKQHVNDINRMKQIMNNKSFIKSPLSSLKSHLTSQIQKKMQLQ